MVSHIILQWSIPSIRTSAAVFHLLAYSEEEAFSMIVDAPKEEEDEVSKLRKRESDIWETVLLLLLILSFWPPTHEREEEKAFSFSRQDDGPSTHLK